MYEWIGECADGWVSVWMGECGWMGECVGGWVSVGVGGWVSVCMDR